MRDKLINFANIIMELNFDLYDEYIKRYTDDNGLSPRLTLIYESLTDEIHIHYKATLEQFGHNIDVVVYDSSVDNIDEEETVETIKTKIQANLLEIKNNLYL
jgi:hypothetical protein